MADSLVDFATLDSAATAVEETAVDSTVVEETPVVGSTTETTTEETTTEGSETETTNADGTEKSPEEQEAFKKAASDKAASDKTLDSKATPDNVRKALKAMRDADPTKNGDVVKQLHGSFERWNAAKEIFPKGVAEMREAKDFIELVGGPEGYQKMQDSLEMINSTDELLYSGDPQIWDNVIEDIKAAGHPEALGALAPSFLSKLKEHDSKAYYDTFTPHFVDGLKEVHFDSFVTKFNNALAAKNEKGESTPDMATVTGLVKSLTDWYKDMEANAKPKEPVDSPERKKFLAEKAEFEKAKQEENDNKKKTFETGVAEECDKFNNTSLGKILGGFLKMPFFKDFPRETIVDLGNGIKERLYSALKADKAYQTQMNAMWKQKNPDKAKIVQYHKAKLEAIGQDIVTRTVQQRYPGYAKGGSAAGRVAVAAVNKNTSAKVAAQSIATGKPIYVASRPENLVREPIKVGGKDYTTSDLVTMQITGKGFVKTTDGKGYKFVTWRK